ncbi:DUF192 domain-containing protein [Candidatus Parcubacteria bacterium]|nr:DUF192 domain-containing protein [Candidatus Parcubacteria bacterium]
MKIETKVIIIFISFLLIAFSAYQFNKSTNTVLTFDSSSVSINDKIIKVEIADDLFKRTKGLSNVIKLEEDAGMLFKFNDKQIRSFWMKNMNFSLDILWIDGNKIIKISKDLKPEGDEPKNKYFSLLPVDYVLELNGGYCDRNEIKVGDEIKYYFD